MLPGKQVRSYVAINPNGVAPSGWVRRGRNPVEAGMTTLELLRQIASGLARQIEAADEEQLRRISSAIAQAAVERSGLSHPVITEEISIALRSA